MGTSKRFVAKNGLDNNGQSITNLGASGASLTLSGANALTLTTTGSTSLTLPTSGTLVTTGDSGTITSAMIADGTIVNGDINASAAIAYGKLALTGSIVNADISASAAIANSKLANSSITVNGSAISLGGSATVTANVPNALTISTGLSLSSGSTFDGSAARTLSADTSYLATLGTSQTISGAKLFTSTVESRSTSQVQLRLAYSSQTWTDFTVDDTDNLTINPVDVGPNGSANKSLTANYYQFFLNGQVVCNSLVVKDSTYKATFSTTSLTSNKTLTVPDTTGTIVTTGDTGTVTSTMIANGTIVDADINASAAIAYSKLSLTGSIVNADISASAAIANSKLANSSVTVNGTAISLGASGTVTANTSNSMTLKFDSGTTEGTDQYVFNGGSAKSVNIVAGSNITLTKTSGQISIAAAGSSISGSGSANQLTYWSSSSALTGSSNLTFDGTKLNVGGGTSTSSLEVLRSDNTNFTAQLRNSGGQGKVLYLKTASSGTGAASNVFQIDANTDTIFTVHASNSPAMMVGAIADNTNFTTQLTNSGGSGNVLKLITASTGSSTSLLDMYTSTSTRTFNFQADGAMSVNHGSPSAALHVIKTTEQLRVGYDTSNYYKTTVGSTGTVTLDAVGSGAKFTFSDAVEVPNEAYGSGWNGKTEVPTKDAVYDKLELMKTESIIIAASDETTALTAGTDKVKFRMPYAFTVTAVRASLSTAQASGNIFTVDINEAGTSILSTKLTIDNTETSSQTAATAPVISDSSIADDAEISIDIDQIGNGSAKGLKVVLIGYKT